MLITVSGMVGSGKSTTTRHLVELLNAAGFDAEAVRFRSLSLFRPGRTKGKPVEETAKASQTARWSGFRARPLSAGLTAGYIGRVVAFRLFVHRRSAERCEVLDRYFYDNLIHYELRTARERAYAALLRRLIPEPDLAILLVASEETLSARRPNYAREYIHEASSGYARLLAHLPRLVQIRTDPGFPLREQLEAVIRERFHHSAASRAGRERHAD